jgi:hypothetical protein
VHQLDRRRYVGCAPQGAAEEQTSPSTPSASDAIASQYHDAVAATAASLRKQRHPWMIEGEQQYVFTHAVISNALVEMAATWQHSKQIPAVPKPEAKLAPEPEAVCKHQ